MASPTIKLTSHVGRDLLDSASSFKTEAAVVWEYVVNSIQYIHPGLTPKIQVNVDGKGKFITISDNGTGMSRDDLGHFFTMHGENKERIAGRPGRGKFGTGKSAAFGIANTLRIVTRKNGHENGVYLTRDMVTNSSGGDIPLKWTQQNVRSNDPDGTIIYIEDIILDKIRTAPIIDYIERHLRIFRAQHPKVAVNSHICEPKHPDIEAERTFEPNDDQKKLLGDVHLIVRVSRAPLPSEEQGIAVTAGLGNLVGIEKAGMENREFGSYLFGEIDVPNLETCDSPIVPYDSSRNLQLNPRHPIVAILVSFIGPSLEVVRKELVRKAKEARKSEQARRLAEEADKIARLLNSDFQDVRQRLQEIRAASAPKGSASANVTNNDSNDMEEQVWVRGTQVLGEIPSSSPNRTGNGKGSDPPDLKPSGIPDSESKDTLDPVGGDNGTRRKPSGGFRVRYENLGKNMDRSLYDASSLTILINLDHPVVCAALGQGSVEDIGFRRLSYEIAFTEYAMALGYHICEHDPDIPPDDLLYEVRTTVNRISLSAAALYYS